MQFYLQERSSDGQNQPPAEPQNVLSSANAGGSSDAPNWRRSTPNHHGGGTGAYAYKAACLSRQLHCDDILARRTPLGGLAGLAALRYTQMPKPQGRGSEKLRLARPGDNRRDTAGGAARCGCADCWRRGCGRISRRHGCRTSAAFWSKKN